MSATYKLDGALYADMIKSGAVNLRNNAQTVNELNVFPIPDGDTGENMARTLEGGVAAIASIGGDLSEIVNGMADGMLLAARGNSGVILSQFFEGMRRGLNGLSAVDVPALKRAFASGVKQAYSAVVQPTEGTILTVMREAQGKAQTVPDSASIEEYFDVFIEEMYASLERTPDLLPVLREAGVIDSGGAGFVYIIEGMSRALRGEIDRSGIPEQEHVDLETAATADDSKFNEDSPMEFGYCTELIVQLMSKKTDVEKYDVKELINYLESIGGESIVAFKTGTRVKLHVHTFEPDRVFEYCRSIGEFVTVKVENMSIQHSGSVVRNRFERQTPKKDEHKPYACVAVADGAGLIEQFTSLGADYVIDGKQTLNPSTQEFIAAFDAVNADSVFVFPNNSNVILTANQAAKLYKKSRIYVVPTTTLAEGYSALSMLDYSPDDPYVILDAFKEAIDATTTGLVTYSIRDCDMNGREIKKGDWIGFADKTIISNAKTITECACELLDKINKKDKSVIIAIRGKSGADDASVAAIAEHLKKTSPQIEFYDFNGDQDVYSFIFVVE